MKEGRKSPVSLLVYCFASTTLHLIYLRSLRLREANFRLYIDCLSKLIPWCFSLDHTHYARWLSVHVRDIASLFEINPKIANKFCECKFAVQKTLGRFSSIAIDHAHEQNNAVVKGDGGAICLTQDADLLRRWTVAGPEVARLISEFEAGMESAHGAKEDSHNHEESKSVQATFEKNIKSLVEVMEDMGNPFTKDGDDLFKIDSKEIADKAVVNGIKSCKKVRQAIKPL